MQAYKLTIKENYTCSHALTHYKFIKGQGRE